VKRNLVKWLDQIHSFHSGDSDQVFFKSEVYYSLEITDTGFTSYAGEEGNKYHTHKISPQESIFTFSRFMRTVSTKYAKLIKYFID